MIINYTHLYYLRLPNNIFKDFDNHHFESKATYSLKILFLFSIRILNTRRLEPYARNDVNLITVITTITAAFCLYLNIVTMWYSETLSYLHTTNLVVIAAYAALITFLFLVIVKLYTWMTTGVYRGTTSMKGKVVIITGCNSGNETHFYKYNMVGHGAHKCIYYTRVSILFSYQALAKKQQKMWLSVAPE